MTGGARTETSLEVFGAEIERGKRDSGRSSSGRNSGSSGKSRSGRSMSSTKTGGDPISSFLVGVVKTGKPRLGGVGVKSGVLYAAFMFDVGRGEKSRSPTGFGSGGGISFFETCLRALKSFRTSRGLLLVAVAVPSRLGSILARRTVNTGACFPNSLRPRMYGAGKAVGSDVVRDIASVGRGNVGREGTSDVFFLLRVPNRSSNSCASSSRSPPGALLESWSRLDGPTLGWELGGSRMGEDTRETSTGFPAAEAFRPARGL